MIYISTEAGVRLAKARADLEAAKILRRSGEISVDEYVDFYDRHEKASLAVSDELLEQSFHLMEDG